MAEMYGELMEFNDRLHKQMNKKDAVIIRLGQTITMAQIEVCLHNCSLVTHSHCASSYHMRPMVFMQMPIPASQLPPEALQPRKFAPFPITCVQL